MLQPKLGIWLTAVVFVGIHGYLNPKNWRISIYGIYLTIVIALTGYLSKHFGLTTAIITHMIIDVILFYKLAKNNIIHENKAANLKANFAKHTSGLKK